MKASRLRGEGGGQGDGAKLQEVVWTKFGDGLAVEGKEKGESRTAAREEEAPRTEPEDGKSKDHALGTRRPRHELPCSGPATLPLAH